MSEAGKIMRVTPGAAIPGGEVAIECVNFDTSHPGSCGAWFDSRRGDLVAASTRRVLAIVPDIKSQTAVDVRLESRDAKLNAPGSLIVGEKLAEDLHLVANPAFDPQS